jgi:putative acetyltransferase
MPMCDVGTWTPTPSSHEPSHRITRVTAEDTDALAEVTRLFAEYAEWLAPRVTHTSIEGERESLPSPFSPPGGALFVGADAGGAICGCVGVKRHSDSAAEIKRLFVREGCRGSGLGRALFEAALDETCRLGYAEALVSTIPSQMPMAAAMYARIGFTPTHRFEDHEHPGIDMSYLRLDLGDWCA